MLKLLKNKIYLTRGDTAILKVKIEDMFREEYIPAETDKILLTVKKTTTSKKILFQKELKNGGFLIEPADTSELSYGDYIYDCQLETESGIVQTIITPTIFRITEEVTY